MTQTSVTEFRVAGVAGQVHNTSVAETETKVTETATSILPGEVVVAGTLEDDVIGVAAAFTQTTFRGITMYSAFQNEKALSTGINSYLDKDPIPILKEGIISVLLGGDVSEGGIGFFVHTVGTSALHTWRADIDTDKASEVPGRYMEDGVSGAVVKFRLSTNAGTGSILT